MKKFVALALTIALAGWTSVATAQESEELISADMVPGEFSANMAFTTDYMFRGFSQTSNGNPAVQAGIDWSHDFGVYAGMWGSNIDFDGGVTDGSIELDYYAGFANEVEGVTYDLGAIFYHYPGSAGASNYDYWEFYGGLGYDFDMLSASFYAYYSPEYTGKTGDTWYPTLDVSVPLPKSLALNAHLGHLAFNNAAGDDYWDWSIGLSAVVLGFDMSLDYVGTDETRTTLADDRAVFTVARSF